MPRARFETTALRHALHSCSFGWSGLRDAGLRVEVDLHDETVGEKIRRAITQKHPAVLVVGDSDVDAGTVGLRMREDDGERRGTPLDAAVDEVGAYCAPPR